MENEYIVDPDVFCMELRVPAIADSLTEKQKIKLYLRIIQRNLYNNF